MMHQEVGAVGRCGEGGDSSWSGLDLAEASIAVKELLPIVAAAAIWGHMWSSKTVLCQDRSLSQRSTGVLGELR